MDDAASRALMDLLDGLDAVSVASLSPEGRVLETRGFLAGVLPAEAAAAFIEPGWAALRAAPEGPVRGAFSIAPSYVLNGVLRPVPGGYLFVAERPEEDIEGISRATVRISKELAAARRELAQARGALAEREEQARVASFFDRITGLGNQRSFNQALANEVLRAERYGGPLALLMASIDGLEGMASHLGAEPADDVLRCFATVVSHATRKTDIAFRIGENRFVLILTHTASERATQVAERVRSAFAAAAPGMAAAAATVSFGHADWRAQDDAATLVARVEAALEIAKGSGGNRVRAG